MSADAQARIEQLSGKLNTRFMVRKELKKLPEMLHEGEEVLNLAQGRYEGNEGLIAVTDRRILFVDEGLVRSQREDFPYGRVSSVQSSKGMLSGKLTIFASGNKAQIDNIMPKEQAESIAEHIRNEISSGHQHHAATTSDQAVPKPAHSDPYEKLKKLGELRDAGVLSEEEFREQKAVLLKQL
jgi:hypothetical protein